MIDPTLERHLADSKELMARWREFRDFIVDAVRKKSDAITPDKEMAFLKCKSKIAMLHDSYLEAVRSDPKIAQNIMQLVSRSITLKHVAELSIAESKKFEIEWHESYLQLEDTIGELEEERERLSQITKSTYVVSNYVNRVKRAITLTLNSALFKFACVAIVLVGILVAAIVLDVNDRLYDNPKTKNTALMIESVVRFIQPDLAFRRLDEGFLPERLPGNKPGDFDKLLKFPETNKDKAAELAKFGEFDGTETLKKADEFAAQIMRFKTNDPSVHMYYFRLAETKDAVNLMEKFGDAMENQGKTRRVDPNDQFSFFRKANVIVMMEGKNWGARAWLRKNIFGVYLDDE